MEIQKKQMQYIDPVNKYLYQQRLYKKLQVKIQREMKDVQTSPYVSSGASVQKCSLESTTKEFQLSQQIQENIGKIDLIRNFVNKKYQSSYIQLRKLPKSVDISENNGIQEHKLKQQEQEKLLQRTLDIYFNINLQSIAPGYSHTQSTDSDKDQFIKKIPLTDRILTKYQVDKSLECFQYADNNIFSNDGNNINNNKQDNSQQLQKLFKGNSQYYNVQNLSSQEQIHLYDKPKFNDIYLQKQKETYYAKLQDLKKKYQKKPDINEKYLTPGQKSLRFKNHYFQLNTEQNAGVVQKQSSAILNFQGNVINSDNNNKRNNSNNTRGHLSNQDIFYSNIMPQSISKQLKARQKQSEQLKTQQSEDENKSVLNGSYYNSKSTKKKQVPDIEEKSSNQCYAVKRLRYNYQRGQRQQKSLPNIVNVTYNQSQNGNQDESLFGFANSNNLNGTGFNFFGMTEPSPIGSPVASPRKRFQINSEKLQQKQKQIQNQLPVVQQQQLQQQRRSINCTNINNNKYKFLQGDIVSPIKKTSKSCNDLLKHATNFHYKNNYHFQKQRQTPLKQKSYQQYQYSQSTQSSIVSPLKYKQENKSFLNTQKGLIQKIQQGCVKQVEDSLDIDMSLRKVIDKTEKKLNSKIQVLDKDKDNRLTIE